MEMRRSDWWFVAAVAGVVGATCGLIGCKLAGLIDWSWWWVTAPAWIALGVTAVGALALGAASAFLAALENR